MFLVPRERHYVVRATLGSLLETPFRFAGQCSNIFFAHD